MAHINSPVPLLRRPPAARRREHTLDKPSTLDPVQTLVWQRQHRLETSLSLPQAQAHSDTLASNRNSQRMACLSNQHTDSQDMSTRQRNSKLQHTANLLTVSQSAMNLLSKAMPKEPLEWSSRVSRV